VLQHQLLGLARSGGEHTPDRRERHVDLPQRADEPGLWQLVGAVVAVARFGIDVAWQ
jgi:hypothetical protein